MKTQQEFRNHIVEVLLEKCFEIYSFDQFSEEDADRIRLIADKLSTLPEDISESVKQEEEKSPKLPLETPINELHGIPANILKNLCTYSDIKTLGDLVNHSTLELCRYRRIGRLAVDQITYFLKMNNLKLKDQ